MSGETQKPVQALLTAQDFLVALRSLRDADLARLVRVAELLAAGISGWCGADLLQTAIERALYGKRRCPVDLNVVVFLGRTMESIASNERRKARAGEAAWMDAQMEAAPELSVQARMELDEAERALRMHVADAFATNANARVVALAKLDGLSAEQIRDATGLDEIAYDSAVRAIRREVLRRLRGGP